MMTNEIVQKKRGRPFKKTITSMPPEVIEAAKYFGNYTNQWAPITLTLKVNNETIVKKTDNVLKVLRVLNEEIVITSVKTMAEFQFEMDGKIFRRFLRVGYMKMLLYSDDRKKMMAKVVNNTLGLSGEYLYQ